MASNRPRTAEEIEERMARIKQWKRFEAIKQETERLLDIMEKVEGETIVMLVLTAAANMNALIGVTPTLMMGDSKEE